MKLPSLILLAALAGCAPRIATFDGAESASATDIVRVATIRVIGPATARPEVELRASDGVTYAGTLRPADGEAGVGGAAPLGLPTRGARLVGTLNPQAPAGGPGLACRFDVLNPRRWIDGGGVGLCRSDAGRRTDFVF